MWCRDAPATRYDHSTMSASTPPFDLVCDDCHRVAPPQPFTPRCPACDGALGITYRAMSAETYRQAPRAMWGYGAVLPVDNPAQAVTLDEGGTPLIPARGDWGCRVWMKDETRNPTGSHKDRALSVAISRGRELGFTSCVILSAGSTGLSTAAYAARAGMTCALVAPYGTPDARLLPAALYGARIHEAPGTFDDALHLIDRLAAEHPIYFTSTYRRGNPFQAEGARTIGFEIAAQLAPEGGADVIVIPVGGGGTLAGIWRAYQQMADAGLIDFLGGRLPRLIAVQPTMYNAFEIALERDLHTMDDLYALGISEETPTIQAKLQHGVPPDSVDALAALRASHGHAISIADDHALRAQARLAATEGVYGEPSTGTGMAGIETLVARGLVGPHDRVVVLACGGGFRETHAITGVVPINRHPLHPDRLLEYLGIG